MKPVFVSLLALMIAPVIHSPKAHSWFGSNSSFSTPRYQPPASAEDICVYEYQDRKYHVANRAHNGAQPSIPEDADLKPWSSLQSLGSESADMMTMMASEGIGCKCPSSFRNGPAFQALGQLTDILGMEKGGRGRSTGGYYFGVSGGSYTEDFKRRWTKRNGMVELFPSREKLDQLIATVNGVSSKGCHSYFRIAWNFKVRTLKALVDAYAKGHNRLASDARREAANTETFKHNMPQLPQDQLCKTLIRFNGLPATGGGAILPMKDMGRLFVQNGKAIYKRENLDKKDPYIRFEAYATGTPVTAGTTFGCTFGGASQIEEDEYSGNREPTKTLLMEFYGMPFATATITYPVTFYRKFDNLAGINNFLKSNGFEMTVLSPEITRFMPEFMYTSDRFTPYQSLNDGY